jgi:hypothetical protein
LSDGTPNACSALYGAAARVAKELGYLKIQTFILPEEGAISLKAAGWKMDGVTKGSQWHTGEPSQEWRKKRR